MNLEPILDWTIPTGTKGIPVSGYGVRIRDVAEKSWHLLSGDVPLPAAVIKRSAVKNNLAAFQRYLTLAGMQLSPHGKTTMCPQLFSRQIDAGAWGITVATFAQAITAIESGVRNVLLANELIGEAEIDALSGIYDRSPDVLLLSLVDSRTGLERITSVLAGRDALRPFDVLIELGIQGRRCGLRDVRMAEAIARSCHESPRVNLRGVAGYEGVIVSGDQVSDARQVTEFLGEMVAFYTHCREQGWLTAEETTYISAGGSAYFDLVAKSFQPLEAPRLVPLLRSGCYLSHDSGFYAALLAHVKARCLHEEVPSLLPALQVWAQVVSRPEAGLAIIGAGRRDLSDDAGMPSVQQWYRRGMTCAPQPIDGGVLFKMNDQHGYMSIPESVDLRVGDYIGLGISHPCTTFDRWPVLLEVDDDYRVLDALKTFF